MVTTSSHHAAAVVNEATTSAATVMSRVRVARGPFDAAAFVSAAGAASSSACSIGTSSAAPDTRSATTGRVATAAARPCARYPWSASRLTWTNERVATEAWSDTGSDSGPGTSFPVSCTGPSRVITPVSIALATATELSPSTSPTKRNPRLCSVRMKLWSLPLSPSARRAALIRELSVASDTMRPCHTASKSSSLLTIRSRLRMRCISRSNTCGST